MSEGGSARFFDAIARRYDRVFARGREGLAPVLALLPPSSRVLDLGVGTGRELPALLDAGHRPVGLDLSTEMLALCAKRARPIPLVQTDLWKPLPFDAASFDAILALHGTLAHPPSDAALSAFPKEIARVLAPGGVFVAELPTTEWMAAMARQDGDVIWHGEGRGQFVDRVSGIAVDVRLGTEAEWRAWCEGVLDVSLEDQGTGEVRIVARHRTTAD